MAPEFSEWENFDLNNSNNPFLGRAQGCARPFVVYQSHKIH